MAIVVTGKKYTRDSAGEAGPHFGFAGHGVLPFAFTGKGVEGAHVEFTCIVGTGASAATCEIFTGFGGFRGTGIDVALFEDNDGEEAGGRVPGLAHPVGGAANAGANAVTFGCGVFARDGNGAAFGVEASGPGEALDERSTEEE